ncbi:hypothetical protein E2C01_017383 [Portunus trituberculatus]|uniref:Uncharacterized protein n=1 Tax=Portunus trituberculatus TaxID=210409 RepID=A0A5B7DRQ8_PORTR|nr:hypothetical protein [Portunus trituberculatus]
MSVEHPDTSQWLKIPNTQLSGNKDQAVKYCSQCCTEKCFWLICLSLMQRNSHVSQFNLWKLMIVQHLRLTPDYCICDDKPTIFHPEPVRAMGKAHVPHIPYVPTLPPPLTNAQGQNSNNPPINGNLWQPDRDTNLGTASDRQDFYH